MSGQSERPVFSVVIATYDRAGLIERSVRSVLDGSLTSVELIVVDDGSTDDTRQILAAIDDPRLVVIEQDNRGRTAARNRGAAAATGCYLAFLDSDDYAEPEWLERLRAAIEADASVAVACCGCTQRWLDGSGGETRRLRSEPKDLGPIFGGRTGLFLTGTFAVRRALFERIGGYNETMSRGETTELALRLVAELDAAGLTIACVPDALICYEQSRPAMTPRDHEARLRDAKTMLDVHGPRYAAHSPNGRADHFAIAGASSAALGDLKAARGYFTAAIRDDPRTLRAYGRLAIASIPPIARRVWKGGES